jgi:predicted transposase YbfD/YdcC
VIVRKIFVNTLDAEFIRVAWNVPNCRTILCTLREVWKDGKLVSRQIRYFISSLDASKVSPERFLELVKGHWQVENRLHLIKDRWWDEDKHVLFRPGLGEMWSALTNLALSLLRWSGEKGTPITKSALRVAHAPKAFIEKLGY